jgi:hypothetical protein
MNEDLQQIDNNEIHRRIEELESKIKQIEDHKHLGIDNSKELDNTTRIGCKEIRVSGVGIQRNLFAVPFFRAFDIDNLSKKARKIAIALGITGEKDTLSEQDTMTIQVGKGEIREESSREDWAENSFSQIIMIHRPGGVPSYLSTLGKQTTPATYLTARRTPIVFGTGVISGNTLTDSNANFKPAKTAGVSGDTALYGICNAKDSNLNILESNRILEVTKTQLICEDTWTTQGQVNYEIHMPVTLGIANAPFREAYIGDGIIFGYGTRGNNNISSLTFGEGTPEAKILANVGSLYLRQDGGAGTTLYVKESGENTTTGWVAK